MPNMWTLWEDLRYSARLLGKHPGFTLTAVGVLTLGIGVNAGIFGIINGLMIRPLAGADAPGEVVGVFSKDRSRTRILSASCCSTARIPAPPTRGPWSSSASRPR
jgi:hypothetical protein